MFSAMPVQAAEAGPDTLPIHVISVQTLDADDQAEALTKALRQAVRSLPGWSQAEGDYSLEVLTLSLKCPDPPDAGCQSRIADQIRADRYVWGTLGKAKGGNVTGELNFWVRGKGATTYKVDYSANLTEPQDEALKKVAMDAILKLTDGPPKGEVKVSAGGIAAQVFVDGQPLGALTGGQGTFFVPSGKHELVVKAPGYADMISEITVKPTSPTDVTVVPVAVAEKKPINWRRVGGFAAIGAGVGFGALGIVNSVEVYNLKTKDVQDWKDARNLFLDTQNACTSKPPDGTTQALLDKHSAFVRDYCDVGQQAEIMQAIFYSLAGLTAGAGIYLVATSGTRAKEKPTTGLVILPQVNRQGAKIDVGFQF